MTRKVSTVVKAQNECKGQRGCKTSDNGCKGKNSCKGKAVARPPIAAAKARTGAHSNACSILSTKSHISRRMSVGCWRAFEVKKSGFKPPCILGFLSVTCRFRYAPSNASPARTALTTAHFYRNKVHAISGTGDTSVPLSSPRPSTWRFPVFKRRERANP